MGSDRRVVKFRRRRSINIGIVIFLILFVYIAINVYLYFTKEHMSIYEVQEGSNIEDNLFTGLILREEQIINSEKAGYISYFQKEGARVAKNSSVYSIDDSTQILDVIMSSEIPITLTNANSQQFNYEIRKFHDSYSDNNFSIVYDFKEEAQETVLDLLNMAMIDKGHQIQEETGFAYSYNVIGCPNSGIVTYYLDHYESVTRDTVSKDMFNTKNYKKIPLRTTEMITANSPVYKLVTSEHWSILLSLSEEQYTKLLGKEKISFTVEKDDFTTTADLTLFQKGSDYYAELSMDRHLANYLEDRFLDIELHLEATEGLKIPLSSIVDKDFYLVPLEYFTTGGNSGSKGLVKESYDSDTGEVNLNFVPADIYNQDETYGYVDTRLFSSDTWLQSTTGEDRYKLGLTKKLTGVYNVNMGYAVFKRIEILYKNEAYCIIKKNTSYGLSVYDHIALDASTAVEQKIIY